MFVLIIALSIGTIYASDVNVTDSYSTTPDDQLDYQIEVDPSQDNTYESIVDNDASIDVLESENSSTLSTNTDDSNIITSDNNGSFVSLAKSITAKDITKYYKGSTKYTVTFVDLNGTPLVNTLVKITVHGVTYSVKTNNKGVATLAINLKPGTYKVVAENPVTGEKLTTNFKILSTITASNVKKVRTDARKFTATFLKSNGKPLAKKTIKFRLNGRTYNVKTNANGVAKLSLTSLARGVYKIISINSDGLQVTNTIKVYNNARTTLTTNAYTFLKNASSKVIRVKLLNSFGYAPGKGQKITFKVNGKKYTGTTNAYGVASLKLPNLAAGKYNVYYYFTKTSFYKASSASNKLYIIPSKNPTFTVKSTTTFGHGAGTPFKVALTSGSVPLVNKKVTLTVNGVKSTLTTDSNGIVSLPINLAIGTYEITYTNNADSKINSKTGSCTINVVERAPTTIKWTSSTSFYQGTQKVQIQVLDSNNKAVSGGTVKLIVNSKTYTATTSSTGYATFSISFPVGDYSVSFSYAGDNTNAPNSGSATLNVKKIPTISIKDIISAAKTVKTYYQNNKKLPASVTAGGVTLTMPEFLYLMSQAIVQLGNSNTKDIAYKSGIAAPASPTGDNINSRQLTKDNYLRLANNLVTYMNNHNRAPNYASTGVGKIIFEELIDASARILAFYGDNNNQLPNYVTITYGSSDSSPSGTGLNEKNTLSLKELAEYLKSTTNCQVGNSKIKTVVHSLTKDLTSDRAKAEAIYNYVRDKISYSFYYDTKHGAVGTLTAGSGNCVDQSHLLVAMFRTAGLYARYVHGTCKFSSGSTYGHVWTQVLIGDTWTVADATSNRNSFGKIVNWNTNSFTLKGIYREITF